MSKYITAAAAIFATMSIAGCVTPSGPSVAGLGAGSDAAYINGTRGRADAQMSEAQARQYSRQRQQVSEEMSLEQQKRQNTIQNTQGVVNLIGSGVSFFR